MPRVTRRCEPSHGAGPRGRRTVTAARVCERAAALSFAVFSFAARLLQLRRPDVAGDLVVLVNHLVAEGRPRGVADEGVELRVAGGVLAQGLAVNELRGDELRVGDSARLVDGDDVRGG